MDNVVIYLIGGVVIAICIVLLNSTKERGKMISAMRNARNTPPMMLQLTVERKLRSLKLWLYNNEGDLQLQTVSLNGQSSGNVSGKKQRIMQQLAMLENSYSAGKIDLQTYDEHLRKLMMDLPQ